MGLGAGVYPATVRVGGSRAVTLGGPLTIHLWAAQSQGWGGQGGGSTRGSRGHRARAEEGSERGKKQKSPRRKPKHARL